MSLKPQNLGGWQMIMELRRECQKADKPVGTIILMSHVNLQIYWLLFNIIDLLI